MIWRNPIVWVFCALLILAIGLVLAVQCAQNNETNLLRIAIAAQVIMAGTILLSWSLEIVIGKRRAPFDPRMDFRVVGIPDGQDRHVPRQEQPPAEPAPEITVAPHPPANPPPPMPP